MRSGSVGRGKEVQRRRAGALWICSLAGLLAIAMALPLELRSVHAQISSPQAAAQQDSASPAQDTGTQARPLETPDSAPTDPRQKKIADDTANLLALANRLKAEVDQTTVDTLSIGAVRDVQEIQRLAHKMRGK